MGEISQNKHHLVNQSLRYLIGGGAVFLLDILVFLAISGSLPEMAVEANIISKVCGAIFGFFVHKYWTFSWKKSQSGGAQFLSYAGLLIFNLMLSSALVYCFIIQLGMWVVGSKLVSDFIVIAVAFLLSRNLVFKGVS